MSTSTDLPPDVLREISGRLRDAADYVHFHAVCKPWRSSQLEATSTTARNRKQLFLPWLLAPEKTMDPYTIFLKLRSVFSRTSFRALPPFSVRPRNWVASADGTAVWYFTARPSPSSPSLRDPLTGAVALLLPPFPQDDKGWWRKDSPQGIVHDDGTVLLWAVAQCRSAAMLRVRATLLRPGDAAWTVVERTFESSHVYAYESRVVYHRGKILIVLDGPVVTLSAAEDGRSGDVLAVSRPSMPGELGQNFYVNSFFLESDGELLCVSVHANTDYEGEFGGKAMVPGLLRALSMSVHVLVLEEEEEEAGNKIRWVRKDDDGRSLADRVLFLGWPNSFAVDIPRLDGDAVRGGCAYFVYDRVDSREDEACYVFSYDLLHHKVKFVEQLPNGWVDHMCTWLFPQPAISPMQEIVERIEGRKWWKKPFMALNPTSNIYFERPQQKCYNQYFRVFVRNLPPKVDSLQLQQFFRKYGNVSNAKVMMSKRKNKTSKKFGLVTIAMVEELAVALAALNGLVFNGCILEVRLVRRWKGRRVSGGYPRVG